MCESASMNQQQAKQRAKDRTNTDIRPEKK